MKTNKLFILLTALILLNACSNKEDKNIFEIKDFSGLININHTPKKNHPPKAFFTDMGNWYGFTCPENTDRRLGFCGPFNQDLSAWEWISDALVQVRWSNDNNSKKSFQKKLNITDFTTNYMPGKAILSYTTSKGTINQSLFFPDSSSTMINIHVSKSSKLEIYGKVNKNYQIKKIRNKLIIKYSDRKIKEFQKKGIQIYYLVVSFQNPNSLTLTGNSYTLKTTSVKNTKVNIRYKKENNTKLNTQEELLSIIKIPNWSLNNNDIIWQKYINRFFRSKENELDSLPSKNDKIAVKAMMTLISNYKHAKGDLHHRGIVPSSSVQYFMGFWAWDSWKHAAAVAKFDPNLAKDQIRAMFDYQAPDGMIPDCIYTTKNCNNYRNSKPPLAAWAVYEIYKADRDIKFVKEMLPLLLKYYNWWFIKRDYNHNGLCEYGSTDGSLKAAKWESGMDNAVRFDNTKMLPNKIIKVSPDDTLKSWSMDQESCDLNSFLALESRILTILIKKSDYNTDLKDYPYLNNRTSKQFTKKVAEQFFDEESGFFYDRKLKNNNDNPFIKVEGTEAAIPIWTEIATNKQVSACTKIFLNQDKFLSYVPFSTVSLDNSKFNPNAYWRGSIWLDQVYFCIEGLRRYGYIYGADLYTQRVFDRLEGLNESKPIYENYNPLTGKAMEAPNFSWSAASLLLLYDSLD
ncbi:MAG: trehalase family glycosidase [Bacteroidales bacterium]